MPSTPIYIRNEDYPIWQSLKDYKGGVRKGGGVSAWLHDKLEEEKEKQERQSDKQTSMDAPHLRPKPHPRPLDDIMERLDTQVQRTTTIPTPFVPRPPDPETGYPCCQLAKPCKHWSFDGTSGVWVNELTGKTKEVA